MKFISVSTDCVVRLDKIVAVLPSGSQRFETKLVLEDSEAIHVTTPLVEVIERIRDAVVDHD